MVVIVHSIVMWTLLKHKGKTFLCLRKLLSCKQVLSYLSAHINTGINIFGKCWYQLIFKSCLYFSLSLHFSLHRMVMIIFVQQPAGQIYTFIHDTICPKHGEIQNTEPSLWLVFTVSSLWNKNQSRCIWVKDDTSIRNLSVASYVSVLQMTGSVNSLDLLWSNILLFLEDKQIRSTPQPAVTFLSNTQKQKNRGCVCVELQGCWHSVTPPNLNTPETGMSQAVPQSTLTRSDCSCSWTAQI